MKKIILVLVFLFIVVSTVVLWFVFSRNEKQVLQQKSNQEILAFSKELEILIKNKNFFNYFGTYSNLLDEDKYKKFTDITSKIEKDKNFEEFISLAAIAYIFKYNPEIKEIFINLKEELQNKKVELTENQKKEYFDFNNKCVGLISDINKQIKDNELLEFIFYSGNQNDCIYIIRNKYRTGSGFDETGYDTLEVYKTATQQKVESYRIGYHYDYPYGDKEENEKESLVNKKRFINYILENSNYNIELIKDLNFFYSY